MRALDLDRRQFWLLVDLFRRLSTRGELTGQLGFDRGGLLLWCRFSCQTLPMHS